ncbi:uncharacterized protein TRIADDRAFT_20616 [Trichoplax adhaerens]|uniref:WD repeat-containing protein 90 n=1 Tax=Trichoplax adhaerens TaxID=10228 RepID=B3RPT0_TRIAD|nr:hypothetical protein TRIADDRAFT_20616 [Trichoplax adhaerens]EDV28238.1 hypothetical protein TRIADDRAFT_20616 [Trichoplax adhaerens]|eukprot:XP_002110072.1 hypothetical protein TRIADDRAFT_20616 [Trichoplax adhaerens]
MVIVWQQPYVNVFKHFDVFNLKRASKEGDALVTMDKTLRSSVFKIIGSIPASNYLQIPKTSSQSLGLIGRYLYLLFRPIPSKYFVVHMDVATDDGLIVRISFSNLFREFKSTSTWLQFPFIVKPANDQPDTAPSATRWTVLLLDMSYVLSAYLNYKYAYLKSIRLCANMYVKGIFTSDMEYEPGTFSTSRRKTAVAGIEPLPREMTFPIAKGRDWYDVYDCIKFPVDTHRNKTDWQSMMTDNTKERKLRRIAYFVNKIPDNPLKLGTPPRTKVPSKLPKAGTADGPVGACPDNNGEVHVYAYPKQQIVIHEHDKKTGRKLKPDPILNLKRIIGFGGSTSEALWTCDGSHVLYACNAVIVAMEVSSGDQRLFIGHTDKISSLSFNGNSTVFASSQTGQLPVIRIWDFYRGDCLAMFKSHVHSVYLLSFSFSGDTLCGVGKDNHGKQLVIVWNTSDAQKSGEVTVIAKAHTDANISKMKISAFDSTRLVSCGLENIRFWRIREQSLRSCPVNLKDYHNEEFTDIVFADEFNVSQNVPDRRLFASSASGRIYEIHYGRICIDHVYTLTSVGPDSKSSVSSINTIRPGISFFAIGTDDGYLRLWAFDFKTILLEAEHEGPIAAIDVTKDGSRILVTTKAGNVGYLEYSTRNYVTIMRSHLDQVVAASIDSHRRHLVTASRDETIRIWDIDTYAQLFDFKAPGEVPCAICYHPSQQCFACGFTNGTVRTFHVGTSSLLAEHSKNHPGRIIGLAFSPSGRFMYSAGTLGAIALYDATSQTYDLLRLLPYTIARGDIYGPDAISVSSDSKRIVFVGPTEFTVTIMDARSLDEVLKIDIGNAVTAAAGSTTTDRAVKVHFAPAKTNELLVITSSCKLLRFSANNGQLLSEVRNIHREECTSLDVSLDSRYLATAGDKVIKIWDYHMRLDQNYQLFIGHSSRINQVMFTPDMDGLISVGDGIFIWNFMGQDVTMNEYKEYKPRSTIPQPIPITQSPSTRRKLQLSNEDADEIEATSDQSEREDESNSVSASENYQDEELGVVSLQQETNVNLTSAGTKRRYAAPPNQAGLKLHSTVGYNGCGRGNMVWHPDTGFFAYTNGCIIVIEDLQTGKQTHLKGHIEEVSTLALQNDCQVLASAALESKDNGHICLWNTKSGICEKILKHHKGDICCLAFSRDDRFLISVGNYLDCAIVVWSTNDHSVLAATQLTEPIHDLCWDPYTVNEFSSVGANGKIKFWLLDETNYTISLNKSNNCVDFTSVGYAGDSILYAATNSGIITAWDTRNNSCFAHWEADKKEIGVIVCRGSRMVTGSCTNNLRLWSIVGIGEMRLPGGSVSEGLTMEDEMPLDGAIIAASFDESIDTGIVGTTAGTLWYINWPERASIRLVSGQTNQVNDVVFSGPDDKYFGTCGADGSLRIWTTDKVEQTLQFQVMGESTVVLKNVGADSITYPTHCVAGYSDGTVRLFDIEKIHMVMKMQPHANSVTAITYAADGSRVILSGSADGLIAINSPSTGLTLRVLNDHKGASILGFDVAVSWDEKWNLSSPLLWLGVSADRRISIWSADWSKDFCELVDWLTFAAPDFAPEETLIKGGLDFPPSLAAFSKTDSDIVIYTGYGIQKEIIFYSLSQQKIIRQCPLTHWMTSLDVSPKGQLIAMGCKERLVQIMDFYEGSFQDFVGHSDCIKTVKFSPSGNYLITVGYIDVLIWSVTV